MILPAGRYFGSSVCQISVNGLTLTLSHYKSQEVQPWHTHENPTFLFLIRGGIRDRLPDQDVTLERTMLVYHPMEAKHCSEVGPQGGIGLNIEASLDWLSGYQLSAKDLGSYAILSRPAVRVKAMRLLLHAFSSASTLPGDIETDTFEILAPLIVHHSSGKESRPPRWLHRVHDLLHDLGGERVSLRDAALEAEVHPIHLARVFRTHYGCSIGEYSRQIRLLHAASCVLENQSGLSEAAHEAGFADQAHFTRFFVQAFGTSPKALARLPFPS